MLERLPVRIGEDETRIAFALRPVERERDLVLPEGVELRSDLDLSVVSVVTPKAEEEAAPAEAVAVEGEAAAEGEKAEGAEAAGDEKEEKGDD